MPILDEFSGFEFEDLMEDVFRNLGYENVRQSTRTGDEGRDLLMEEVVEGQRRAVVVECKHKDTVSRPVVQKLHSAVTTYDFAGPKRGIVVTTGRFTQPARDYAQKVGANGGTTIDLIDGTDLRDIAEEIGLDLYNGRIEILCDQTLRPFDPTSSVDAPLRAAFRDVENLDPVDVPTPATHATFHPVVKVEATTNAVFETSVGVVHRIDDHDTFVIHADGDQPRFPEEAVGQLVTDNFRRTVDLDEDALADDFDSLDVRRFGQTETGYKEWAVDRIRRLKTTTVHYTGDNNVDYEKTCEPKQSAVSVQAIDAVYLPQVRLTATFGEYQYPYEHYAAGPSRVTTEDGVRRCVHCGDGGPFTYCANCGSVNCPSHTKTERVEQQPVCTGCAVTERFALRTKYFYDEANLASFREAYEAMPVYEKAMENPPAVVASVVGVALVVLFLLTSTGLL
jgi:restriction endonuclease Mrr